MLELQETMVMDWVLPNTLPSHVKGYVTFKNRQPATENKTQQLAKLWDQY